MEVEPGIDFYQRKLESRLELRDIFRAFSVLYIFSYASKISHIGGRWWMFLAICFLNKVKLAEELSVISILFTLRFDLFSIFGLICFTYLAIDATGWGLLPNPVIIHGAKKYS